MTTILIVDDEPMIRDVLTRMLTRKGYQCITANDGAAAIVRARTDLPALILMDIGLPVMNGWQATHWLKNNQDTKRIPIIVLTANVISEGRLKALDVGCEGYETKPINFEQLFAAIATLLHEKS